MMNITMDLLCSIAQFNFCMLVIYLQEGDVVWCHDYHLMFLPKCLKNMDSHMKVGWFLHTPFPSSEIFRTLPMRSELLRAVLTADLIGFHTYDYARHFVSACTRILGLEGTPEGVEDQGKLTRVAAVCLLLPKKSSSWP
jgi:trehalose 6-phosphate synthase/phosphatase